MSHLAIPFPPQELPFSVYAMYIQGMRHPNQPTMRSLASSVVSCAAAVVVCVRVCVSNVMKHSIITDQLLYCDIYRFLDHNMTHVRFWPSVT